MNIFKSLQAADKRWTSKLCIAEKPGVLRTTFSFLAHSGDSWFWGIGLACIWQWGHPDWKQWALILFVAIFVTATLVMTLKYAIKRQRPSGDWGNFYRKTDPNSFPSGHAARAGVLLGMILWLGPDWIQATMIIYSPLMALARISMGLHYISDVLAGFGLGLMLSIGAAMWLTNTGLVTHILSG
jgi:membrane-associated phospholipid phosphatase|tara:strand:+ start:441 stop:992 length:552 start_codon:yes stop_codon:yes gene_type:complete